jgi:hypothetical protein
VPSAVPIGTSLLLSTAVELLQPLHNNISDDVVTSGDRNDIAPADHQ